MLFGHTPKIFHYKCKFSRLWKKIKTLLVPCISDKKESNCIRKRLFFPYKYLHVYWQIYTHLSSLYLWEMDLTLKIHMGPALRCIRVSHWLQAATYNTGIPHWSGSSSPGFSLLMHLRKQQVIAQVRGLSHPCWKPASSGGFLIWFWSGSVPAVVAIGSEPIEGASLSLFLPLSISLLFGYVS